MTIHNKAYQTLTSGCNLKVFSIELYFTGVLQPLNTCIINTFIWAQKNFPTTLKFAMKLHTSILFILLKLNLLRGEHTPGTCFEENTLFVENSLPFDTTIEQCSGACKSIEECKVIWTWKVTFPIWITELTENSTLINFKKMLDTLKIYMLGFF